MPTLAEAFLKPFQMTESIKRAKLDNAVLRRQLATFDQNEAQRQAQAELQMKKSEYDLANAQLDFLTKSATQPSKVKADIAKNIFTAPLQQAELANARLNADKKRADLETTAKEAQAEQDTLKAMQNLQGLSDPVKVLEGLGRVASSNGNLTAARDIYKKLVDVQQASAKSGQKSATELKAARQKEIMQANTLLAMMPLYDKSPAGWEELGRDYRSQYPDLPAEQAAIFNMPYYQGIESDIYGLLEEGNRNALDPEEAVATSIMAGNEQLNQVRKAFLAKQLDTYERNQKQVQKYQGKVVGSPGKLDLIVARDKLRDYFELQGWDDPDDETMQKLVINLAVKAKKIQALGGVSIDEAVANAINEDDYDFVPSVSLFPFFGGAAGPAKDK